MPDITKMSENALQQEIRSAFWDNATGNMVDLAGVGGWSGAFGRVARYVRSLIPPADQPVARVHVIRLEQRDVLVMPDGRMFRLNYGAAPESWHELPPIPQPAAPELLDAARDALSGWHYIRRHHGDLPGVGWDRVDNALSAAIARADAPTARPRHDTNAVYAALLSTVMDVGSFLSDIVAREDDASKGAHQPGKAEHLRLLAMCIHALDLARKEGCI